MPYRLRLFEAAQHNQAISSTKEAVYRLSWSGVGKIGLGPPWLVLGTSGRDESHPGRFPSAKGVSSRPLWRGSGRTFPIKHPNQIAGARWGVRRAGLDGA